MTNVGEGCIRPPGSRHRDGGYQRLLTEHAQAQAVFAVGNDAAAWRALRGVLVSSVPTPRRSLDEAGEVVGAALPERLEELACGGCWPAWCSGAGPSRRWPRGSPTVVGRGWRRRSPATAPGPSEHCGPTGRAQNLGRAPSAGHCPKIGHKTCPHGGATAADTERNRGDLFLETFLDAATNAARAGRWPPRLVPGIRVLLQGDGRCRDQRGWGPGGAVGVPEPGDRVSAGPDQHRGAAGLPGR